MSRLNLNEGELSLKGKTDDGKAYELTGAVESVEIRVENEYDVVHSMFEWKSTTPHLASEEYWVKFKMKSDDGKNPYYYKVEMETVDVERTARIIADDRTAKAIEAARVLAGAPEDAQFGFSPRYGDEIIVGTELQLGPRPVMVEFVWVEKVVK